MSTTVSPLGPGAKKAEAAAERRIRFESTYACILACNDEARMAGLVLQALSHCGNVIVCDDGSVDKTSDEARRAGAHVIRHETSMGKGRSMSDLVNEVILMSPSGFVLVEREGFGHVDDIPIVLEPIMDDLADVAVGMSGSGKTGAVDAGIMAMNSKALFTLHSEGFFSDGVTSPQDAVSKAPGLRFRVVSLMNVEGRLAPPRVEAPPPSRSPGEGRRTLGFDLVERDFLAMGVPALAFTLVGLWLLAQFVINYNYTGQIAVPMGVRGVIGLVSVIFGMAFMVSYIVVYSGKHGSAGKKQ